MYNQTGAVSELVGKKKAEIRGTFPEEIPVARDNALFPGRKGKKEMHRHHDWIRATVSNVGEMIQGISPPDAERILTIALDERLIDLYIFLLYK